MDCHKRSLFLLLLCIALTPFSSGLRDLAPYSSELNKDDEAVVPPLVDPVRPNIFGLGSYDIFIFDGDIQNLCLHCRSSKGYDFGHACINPGDAGWSWTTKRKLFKRPSFFCEFWLGSTHNATFDVFDSKVAKYCRHDGGRHRCYWLVRNDGFYVSSYYSGFPSAGWTKMHDWQNGS